jgi:Zn-dependent protease with chaperone function
MYGNFIYFILVLLIYTTYYPPEVPYLGPFQTLILFLVLLAMFVGTTQTAFRTLSNKIDLEGPSGQHGRFDRLFTRQAIMAVVMFSINIYILNLKLFVLTIPVFSASPTVTALLFILLFVAYLAIIWAMAHRPYQRLFGTKVSKRSYVVSNISFHLPVILPWLLISAGIDIINLLPFDTPKHFLATPEGQVIFFFCFLAALIVVAPSLIKLFWQCRPLPPGPKRKRIEAMCEKARLGYNNILRWPIFEGRLLTAGVMGLVKRFRYILVTDSLLQILNDDEIDAVMAHEIGHIQKKHLVFYLIFFLGFILLSYAVFDLVLYAILYGNLTFPIARNTWAEPSTLTSVLFTMAMAATLLIYFRYVFGYFMRNCERQADLHAFTLLGTSHGLVSSLEKIATYSGKAHDRPSWHHFSIRQRINFLNKCETDRRWITQHDRKLRRSVMVFVAGLLFMGYLGYVINFGEMGRALNSHFIEKVLVKEIRRNPTNPALYHMLASIHYQNRAYGQAIKAYEKSIELAPRNAEALNNLAWIYATCEEIEYRNPAKALVYAQQAATLKPVPHILDTLAESYYVNTLRQEAIKTIRQALAMNPQDRDYYESQLKKFEEKAVKGLRD